MPSSISVSIRYSVLLILPITGSRSETNFPTFGKSSAKLSTYVEERDTSEFVRKDTTRIVDLCMCRWRSNTYKVSQFFLAEHCRYIL